VKDQRLFSTISAISPDIDDYEEELVAKLSSVEETLQNIDKLKEENHDAQSQYLKGLKSQPKVGGNWNPDSPLKWADHFGGRNAQENERLQDLARLEVDDEGYFDNSKTEVKGISIVQTIEDARKVMERLMSPEAQEYMHACDTEVMEIDLKSVGPVGNGFVTCASIYSGPNFDYGLGHGPGATLWIDNLDDSYGVLEEFKPWFEDERFLKVWHNYGFDRHVMWNEGINVKGFGGDTMHMARLQDTSRAKMAQGGGYSLEALTADILDMRKRPMKELFGVPRLRKDGTEGSLVDLPPVEILQRDPRFREKWIIYSAYDAQGTYNLHEKLKEMLIKMEWLNGKNLYDYYRMHMAKFGEVLTDMERRGIKVDAKDYLATVEKQAREDRAYHVNEFRKWATKKIGPDGLALNPASSTQLCTFLFGGSKNQKTKQLSEEVRVFKVPTEDISSEAAAHYKKKRLEANSNAQDVDEGERAPDEFDQMKAAQLKELCKENGLKVSGKKAELQERLRGYFLAAEKEDTVAVGDDMESMSDEDLRDSCIARDLDSSGSRKELIKLLQADSAYVLELMSLSAKSGGHQSITEALEKAAKKDSGTLRKILQELKDKAEEEPKNVEVTIRSIGMEPKKFTAGGAASVTADVLRELAGDPFGDNPKYGRAYAFLGGGKEGHEACVALYSLTAIGSIDTMIANFLTTLQSLVDHDSRVHCSLNLNTETGRLSSRRPNLQNQPALEKDKYQIRKAFQSSPGNNLIVADYGQLELRLLASMTNCKSMIEAFEAGGDFHSRTALGMFDYIQKKVDTGECLLEWDYSKGEPPKPMLKDEFASERRKAKTLNFSIAYGKTAHGLSQDWGVSTKEAEKMLQAWYDSRPEVLKWQKNTKKIAKNQGITRTLMGRYRQLPEAMGKNMKLIGHAERASINTPIQGGAADVAMMAMNKINHSPLLKRLGWILLMQIHDEVILEGPEETAEEAFEEVLKCMQEPWTEGLEKTSVPLLVDGSHVHKDWYSAK